MILLYALIGRLFVWGVPLFLIGTAIVWFGSIIAMMLSGSAPHSASIGG